MRRLAAATAVLALAALLLAACGGGSDATSTTASASSDITPEKYAAGLDALCKKRDARIAAAASKDSAASQQQVAAIYDDFASSVSALSVPPDLADAQLALLELLPRRPADTSDPAAYMSYYSRLDGAYKELGATGCSAQAGGVMGGSSGAPAPAGQS